MALSPEAVADKKKSLSMILREIVTSDPASVDTLGEIIIRFGRRSFGVVLFVFAMIAAVPVPPGVSIILGLPLLFIAPQMAIGLSAPWLPARLRNKPVSVQNLDKLIERVLPRFEAAERLSRPRLTFLFGQIGDRLIGLICTALALVVMLPVPFLHGLPALAVAVFALAMFNRDGVLALIGYALTALTGGVVFLLGNKIVDWIADLIHFFAR
jgi:hypothetical protein